MWREIVEYDPLTGVRTDFYTDDDGKSGLFRQTSPAAAKNLAEQARILRDDDEYKRKGIRNDFMHAAIIPFWVMERIQHQYGIARPLAQGREVAKIIDRDFPWCKTVKGRLV